MHQSGSDQKDAARFTREAQILADLRHENIVSHIAHGQTADGQRYLAMEWLDGEDLGHRLARGPLPLRDCVALLRHVAQALQVAHARGVIHRDLKPTNLFLCEGEAARVKILDFGIARRLGTTQAMTQTGAVIGTPEYMAPEQARGARDLTPAADIFSVGCVLYECLTGQPPFVADHLAAVLVRILFDDPRSVDDFRLGVPPQLSALLSRMLAKDPTQRLSDGGQLLRQLEELGEIDDSRDALPQTIGGGLAHRPSFAAVEQQLFSVVIAAPPLANLEASSPSSGEQAASEAMQSMLRLLRTLGVQADFLASGALVVTVSQTGSATDQATQAARAALLIKDHWPDAAVSLATGRGALQGRTAVGEVVDRAARSLQETTMSSNSSSGERLGIRIDELSARLLEGRFHHTPRPSGALLISEEKEADSSRLLLGKPTPCVGRDTELGILEGQLSSSLEEPQSQAVLITGQPGSGKSRLRHEFLRRVAKRSEEILIIVGRADLMTAGVPYGILGQALRKLCGLNGGETIEAQRSTLASRMGQRLEESERTRIVEFIGELCGIAFPETAGSMLQLARSDPRVRHDQIRRAFVDWLQAECQDHGVLFVLDDLQWADTLSVGLLDIAMRELRSVPLCVMALARPEVREVFPKLWPGHRLQEISLKPLSRKACERLVQQVLGKRVAPEVLARIVEQSTGNALFLEELIRAAGEGEAERQPETVLAMLQARIGRFELGPRRAARAASVFGQTAWRGGIAELLSMQDDLHTLDTWLSALVDLEILEPHDNSRFLDEKEFGFRHALACDAAYSLLTESDLQTGHRVAARYLSRLGETEPLVLAEHHRRGGESALAMPLYLRAAEESARVLALSEARKCYAQTKQLLDGLTANPEVARQKLDVLIRQVQLGVTADPPEQNFARLAEARGLLNGLSDGRELGLADQRRGGWIDLLSGRIHYYQSHNAEAIGFYRRVLPIGEALKDKELTAVPAQLIGMVLLVQGHARGGTPLLARAVEGLEHLDSDFERMRTLSMYGAGLVYTGDYHKGMSFHRQALERAAEAKQASALGLVQMIYADSLRGAGEVTAWLKESESALAQNQKSGDQIYTYIAYSHIGWAQSLLGNHQVAHSSRQRGLELAQQLGGQLIFSDWFAAADIEMALRAGDIDQALALAEQRAPLFAKEKRIFALSLAEQSFGLALGCRDFTQSEAADAHLGAGLQMMEESGLLFAAARLRLEWAHLCHKRGDDTRANELRSRAVAQYEASRCAELLLEAERCCVCSRI